MKDVNYFELNNKNQLCNNAVLCDSTSRSFFHITNCNSKLQSNHLDKLPVNSLAIHIKLRISYLPRLVYDPVYNLKCYFIKYV
jgi:hypothetical protein